MKVSLRVNFRGGDPVNPLDGVLQDAKKIGFDGIELMLDPDEPLKPGWKGPWSSQDVSAEMLEAMIDEAVRDVRAGMREQSR